MAKKKVTGKFMKVTPARATAWLEKNTMNRPLNQKWIDDLAGAIKRGEWRGDNAQTVKISPEGNLIDGQHRLWAVVEANQTVEMFIAFDVPEETFPTIDNGRKRTTGNVLAIAGFANSNLVAGAARLYVRFLKVGFQKMVNGASNYRISNTQALTCVDENSEILESVKFVQGLPHVKGIYKTKFCFMHAILTRKHSDLANDFITKLYTGENLPSGSPILTLRNKLFSLIGHRGYIHGHPLDHFIFVITVKAWNAVRAKKAAKVLSWGEKEKPPSIK